MIFITFLGSLGPTAGLALGGENVAVIDSDYSFPPTEGQFWCQFLSEHGYTCTLFPKEGPTGSLDPFEVVVDLSNDWTDPAGMLVEFMQSGKTVITVRDAPIALGVNSDPTVQAWIGANQGLWGSEELTTIATDPILGGLPVGTPLDDCSTSLCGAVDDTSGHPEAKVLAVYFHGMSIERIGLMRNTWEGGTSVYLKSFLGEDITLNAIRARSLTIPTISGWGIGVLTMGVVFAGIRILRRRTRPEDSPRLHSLIPLILCLAPDARGENKLCRRN